MENQDSDLNTSLIEKELWAYMPPHILSILLSAERLSHARNVFTHSVLICQKGVHKESHTTAPTLSMRALL